MSHAMVTIICPLPPGRLAEAEQAIEGLGNPAAQRMRAGLERLDGNEGTHFCSLHAIRSKDDGKAYLAFEFSADGTPEEAIARIVRAVGAELAPVFSMATDWRSADLEGYLVSHQIRQGVGVFDNPGLVFSGTPGMTVGRILDERALATEAFRLLTDMDPGLPALVRIERIRVALAGQPRFRDMLETGTPTPVFAPQGTGALVAGMVGSFVLIYLWPVLLAMLVVGLVGGAEDAAGRAPGAGLVVAFLEGAASWLWFAFKFAFVVVVVTAIALYLKLRSLEDRDSVEDRRPDHDTVTEMFGRENQTEQNHMVSVTQRKPGLVRWFTARLVFWVIGQLAARLYRPGFLAEIGSIHFARWVTVPGTRDLVFFSNFDSSWESYLEDFITRAHNGLTGVWSNSIGFPRAENLFQLGATDGERFKRYARQSMIPSRFWYSAYPDLSTLSIRTNAKVRLGLSGSLTEDEAASWLALFGSAPRPAAKLVSSDIQSLVFGGLGKDMPCGSCEFYALPADVRKARAWLTAVMPHVAFGDGRWLKHEAVATLALGPEGLRKLGLPAEGMETFPYAFLEGMTASSRQRLLGDVGDNAPAHWRWGETSLDVALLVYGNEQADVDGLVLRLEALGAEHGGRRVYRVPLKRVEKHQREPFGYADGISQPIIRGTYKALKGADPIHLVEPGEFILGYPDNRSNMPPGPVLPALTDPRNMLPLVAATGDFSRNFVDGVRDVGRDGTYLVIRELEQDVDLFHRYCEAEAKRIAPKLSDPYVVTPEFIGAKLIGRWTNGSSVTRHPYQPKEDHHADADGALAGATERPIAATIGGEVRHDTIPRPAEASHVRDNDFLFGSEDPEALRCPFGAHIRRANPRDSLAPDSKDEIAISNRHRIIRVGRQFEPAEGGKPGLFFMCLNADIERQFEFVQQTWLRNPSFHGMTGEKDPLLGNGDAGTCGFTIPTRNGPISLAPIPAMVATRGGGYFFLPGKRLLQYLAVPP